jgi:RNA polymerase sigma factor (sigma-70 family)
MHNGQQHALVRHLHRLVGFNRSEVPADVDLLDRYLSQRDEAAFEVLVWRHGTLVWNVCRRIVRDEHRAEDAFQATFLTFVRKAGSIGRRESVGSWLYKVAYRVALLTGDSDLRRTVRERTNVNQLASTQPDEVVWRDLRPVLDEEVNRLPGRYRVPFVLCYLEGKTNAEAARQLGCPEGTVVSRLAAARRRLRRRLTQRGITLGTGVLALVLTKQVSTASGISPSLVAYTVKAALQFAANRATGAAIASSQATVLAEGVVKSMFLNKLQKTVVIALVLCFLGAGTGLCLGRAFAGKNPAPASMDAQQRRPTNAHKLKDDLAQMQGTWETTETWLVTGLDQQPVMTTKRKVKMVFSGDKLIRLSEDGFIDEESTIKLDPTKNPKTIDQTSPRLGKFEGIYRFVGDDRLTICSGRKRGTEFPANADELWGFRRLSRTPAKAQLRFPSAPGYIWMVQPTALPGPGVTLGIAYFYDQDRDGAAVITIAYAELDRNVSSARNYRPVLLDSKGTRYLPQCRGGMASVNPTGSSVDLGRWRMDPKVLPAKKVALIGIEAAIDETDKTDSR